MPKADREISPQVYTTAGGILYLVVIAIAFGSSFLRSGIIHPANEVATAQNLVAAALRVRLGTIGEVMMVACDIPLAIILYALLRPVSWPLSLIAALFRILSDVIVSLGAVAYLSAITLAKMPSGRSGFDPRQMHDLMFLVLHVPRYTGNIASAFLGFHFLLLGYLIFRSRYLPRTLGVLLLVGSACGLISALGQLMASGWAPGIYTILFAPMGFAELALALWLLFAGVNPGKWRALTEANTAGSGQ